MNTNQATPQTGESSGAESFSAIGVYSWVNAIFRCAPQERRRSGARAITNRYGFNLLAEFLPLPARNERGEGRGGGSPSLTWRVASSPRPSPPAGDAAEEREKRQR